MNHLEKAFDADLLKMLRDAKGFTQIEAGERAGLSQAHYSKIEGGVRSPDSGQIEALADAFGVTPVFFARPDDPYFFKAPKMYRSRRVGKRKLRSFEAKVRLAHMSTRRLRQAAPVTFKRGVPLIEGSVDELHVYDPIEVARHVRKLWRMGDGPALNLMKFMEAAGIFLLPMKDMPERIDAVFCEPLKDYPPLIIYRQDAPPDRIRYTIAHELGHYVMRHHERSIDEEAREREANLFANELLMPAARIRRYLSRITLDSAALAKELWGVSIAALVRRARDLGVIDDRRYKNLYIEISKRGWRREEPVELDREHPRLLSSMINYHFEQLDYSPEELAEMLGFSLKTFEDCFGLVIPVRHRLRVVS
jgi:Zn-dependent peptidase ImmA (M78 family)/DNA-binding XRE family transcriptional regulator